MRPALVSARRSLIAPPARDTTRRTAATMASGGVSWSRIDLTPSAGERHDVLVRNHASADDQDVVGASFREERQHARKHRHVRAGEYADAEHVDILLDRGVDHLLRRAVQARVDHVHAGIAQRARDDLDAAVVAVEAHLGDEDTNGRVAGVHAHRFRRRGRPRPAGGGLRV